jgi:hypothetical protein
MIHFLVLIFSTMCLAPLTCAEMGIVLVSGGRIAVSLNKDDGSISFVEIFAPTVSGDLAGCRRVRVARKMYRISESFDITPIHEGGFREFDVVARNVDMSLEEIQRIVGSFSQTFRLQAGRYAAVSTLVLSGPGMSVTVVCAPVSFNVLANGGVLDPPK